MVLAFPAPFDRSLAQGLSPHAATPSMELKFRMRSTSVGLAGLTCKMAGMNASVVSASGLSLTFQTNDGPVNALSNVDLTIGKGEFVSFIGPSGCGKTTFLRVIADLEKPTEGTILVNGMTPEQAREKRAYGYVFQAAALFPWRTIGRNIALPLEIMGISKAEQKERIRAHARPRRPLQVREQISVAAFRRHAAARVNRTCAGL